MSYDSHPDYEYIIVGSGAGGGPLAANLAKLGHKVLLLEAGSDPLRDRQGNPQERYTYSVPALHGRATEDPDLRWDYHVKHYANPQQQQRDSKYDSKHGGILYPRAGTLGGCTAHHAMITVYPHNSDWDRIAEITGDDSWHSDKMRRYFERLEHCEYIDKPPSANYNPTRHGFDGWLTTNTVDPLLAVSDPQLLKVILKAAITTLEAKLRNPISFWRKIWQKLQTIISALKTGSNPLEILDRLLDPNAWQFVQNSSEGIVFVPLAIEAGKRRGTREYIRETEQQFPHYLKVQTNALVTQILFDAQNKAIGVEYLEGEHLYQADPLANANNQGIKKQIFVSREVILAAGAFNTPQILKLSGIGAKEELEKFSIKVRVDLPGVGSNLQDRYEVGVVSQMKANFSLLDKCYFREPQPEEQIPDRCLLEWQQKQTGVYTTNGAVLGIIKKSEPQRQEPDLFIFGLPAFFKGYFHNYSDAISEYKDRFTWAVLKAHTNNCAGTVTLKSTDPRDVPEINFRYFDEGNDPQGEDLQSVVAGVQFVREMTANSQLFTKTELLPGNNIDQPQEIAQFIKDEAWGHHACGTCKIGHKNDPMAVLDSQFRVYGTQNLRVVDASVFPYIPGFFIVTPIYMISEKATDVIHEYAKINPI